MTASSGKSILCVGQLVADIVVRSVDALPALGVTDLVDELQVLAGGCAANTAAVLSKLGADVRLAALIGRDALGDVALANLRSTGLCLDPVLRDESVPTSGAVVLIHRSGDRSFLYRHGGNERLANRHVPDNVLRSASIVHVGGAMKLLELDLATLFSRAKSNGSITSIDTDWDTNGLWMKRLHGALPHTDYLFTNEDEAGMIIGVKDPAQAAHALLACGPKAVIIKRGPKGSMFVSKTGELNLLDTTCAGDSFVAGFLRGLSLDLSLAKTMRLANAAGALATTQLSHHGVASMAVAQKLIDRHSRRPGAKAARLAARAC
jgi:sugar/nucleoside kinase (ribokinase family)